MCFVDIDECLSSPCKNDGECIDGMSKFVCNCNSGSTGVRCELVLNACYSNPCAYGNCVKKSDFNFECICYAGYEGVNCMTEKNECDSNPCDMLNSYQCVDYFDEYECKCLPGFTGRNCETEINHCNALPCDNGDCENFQDTFKCTCWIGWTGEICDSDIDDCSSAPCLNGASCEDKGPNFYKCTCVVGFKGKYCDENIDNCADASCYPMGTLNCIDKINDYECDCKDGWAGPACYWQDSCFNVNCRVSLHIRVIELAHSGLRTIRFIYYIVQKSFKFIQNGFYNAFIQRDIFYFVSSPQ